jgi:hypothetical protein
MQERRRVRHTLSFFERLAAHSQNVRAKAASLPAGQERDAMLEKLKQTEGAARITRWLSSAEEDAERPEEAEFPG